MDIEEFLAHHGVKGQKWGIRRDPRTGIRPIASTLDKSRFGRLAKANADRHNRNQSAVSKGLENTILKGRSAVGLKNQPNTVKPPSSSKQNRTNKQVRRLNAKIARRIRVANGRGGIGDILLTVGNQSVVSIVRAKGSLKGAAANDARQLSARRDRIKNGKRKVLDILSIHGGNLLYNV